MTQAQNNTGIIRTGDGYTYQNLLDTNEETDKYESNDPQ